MEQRGWLSGLAVWALLLAAGGDAEAQPSGYAPSAALPPRTVPPSPAAMPLGDAALPPPRSASALPGVVAPDNVFASSAAVADGAVGESPGWLSGVFLDAEYLYLRPMSQGMDYAIANTGSNSVPDGGTVTRDYTWRSGLRAGLGYRLPGQPWSVRFYYTFLHDAASGGVDAPPGGFLFATLTHPGTVSEVQTASAATSLNYNVYDVEVGRWCAPTESLAARFFVGGRFAHIDQNFSAFYDGGDANQDLVARQLHFNGGGFRAGGEAVQNLFWGFNLFARGSAALLGGEFHSNLIETNNAGATLLTNFTDRFEKVVPVAQMTLGMGWKYNNLRLMAGYQYINWFGLVNVPTFVDDAHQGKFVRQSSNLSLQGLVLRAEWWF